MLSFLSFITVPVFLICGSSAALITVAAVAVVRSKRSAKNTRNSAHENTPQQKAYTKEENSREAEYYTEYSMEGVEPRHSSKQQELRELVEKLTRFIGKGFDDSQLARSLIGAIDRDIPKHELMPLIAALRELLVDYDKKSVDAKKRFSPNAKNEVEAMQALATGNPRLMVSFLGKKIDAIEDGGLNAIATVQVGDYARHASVLAAYYDTNLSYDYAKKAVAISPDDVRNLDILGYEHLRRENFIEAEYVFQKAIEIDNVHSDKVWVELAVEGLEIARRQQADGVHAKPDSKRQAMRSFEAEHER